MGAADLVGEKIVLRRSWSRDDTILYALAVGAGEPDPAAELQYTVECRREVQLRPVPTMAAALGLVGTDELPALAAFDRRNIVHGEQTVELCGPLPVEGEVHLDAQISDVADKGSGALVEIDVEARDVVTDRPMFRCRTSLFVRGAGGWGGGRLPSPTFPGVPARPADETGRARTRPAQALLYRLTGDRNPLHADPAAARDAGFDEPILHGLCTFGFSARLLIGMWAPGAPDRLTSMRARFTAPVRPGDELVVESWRCGPDEIRFRTSTAGGTVVLDHGSAVLGGDAG